LAWKIDFEPEARRELKKLGAAEARRIGRVLLERIATRDDPRSAGQALVGEWSGYWRYRIGDYRVIARIEDDRLIILVVRVAHRREAYR
jgi:mRNA interferase RelE/StbE